MPGAQAGHRLGAEGVRMTDEQTTPADPTPAPSPASPAATPEKTRLRDRALGFRAVLAVALAALILGGLGGAAIGVVSSGGDEQRGPGGGRHGFQPGPGQGPGGGLPPGTAPRDDVQPDSGTDSSSDTNA